MVKAYFEIDNDGGEKNGGSDSVITIESDSQKVECITIKSSDEDYITIQSDSEDGPSLEEGSVRSGESEEIPDGNQGDSDKLHYEENSIQSDSKEGSDSDDEPPEGLSLAEGRERVLESMKHQHDAQQTAKEKKKQKHKQWDDKNKKQQRQKKKEEKVPSITGPKNSNAKIETQSSLIPGKLGDRLLQIASESIESDLRKRSFDKFQVDKMTKSQLRFEKRNKRIKFKDYEDEEDEEGQTPTLQNTGIQAKYIGAVSKKGVSDEARKFLKEHFFGRRLKRKTVTGVKTVSQRKRKR